MSSSSNKKATIASIAVMALGMVSVNAHAFDTSKLTARVRAIYIDPANKSDAGALPADDIKVQSKWAPDIDFEYALSDKLALELLLTIPQRHDVTSKTLGSLGTVTHLPPTLTAKYYFATQTIKPYVGAGLNFTWFTNNGLAGLDIKKTSFGPALQAGMDVALDKHWSLSFDAKKAWISTKVRAGSETVTTVHVDPFIYGIGVGYRY